MSWFRNHLNWTCIFTNVIVAILLAQLDNDPPYYFAFWAWVVVLYPIGIWVIKNKGRSYLWAIMIIWSGLLFPLLLKSAKNVSGEADNG